MSVCIRNQTAPRTFARWREARRDCTWTASATRRSPQDAESRAVRAQAVYKVCIARPASTASTARPWPRNATCRSLTCEMRYDRAPSQTPSVALDSASQDGSQLAVAVSQPRIMMRLSFNRAAIRTSMLTLRYIRTPFDGTDQIC